ncbi:MAG: hypothetical protein IPJ34_42475 [Myxococcales bacterium]|nr:hypothetical protein [Myxococcales bacterium]
MLPVLVIVGLLVRHRLTSPVLVTRYVVDRGDVVREVFGRATIESRREVQPGFDLVGRISDVLVGRGRSRSWPGRRAPAPEQLNAEASAASSGVGLAKAVIAWPAADERRPPPPRLHEAGRHADPRARAAAGSASGRDPIWRSSSPLAQADLDRVHAAQGEAQKQIAVASGTTDTKLATVTRAVLVSPSTAW